MQLLKHFPNLVAQHRYMMYSAPTFRAVPRCLSKTWAANIKNACRPKNSALLTKNPLQKSSQQRLDSHKERSQTDFCSGFPVRKHLFFGFTLAFHFFHFFAAALVSHSLPYIWKSRFLTRIPVPNPKLNLRPHRP